MSKGTVLALLLVVLGGGYGLGRLATRDKTGGDAAAATTAAAGPTAGDGVDRVRVPLDGPMKGPANAKVTIVEFSDFQCPFCGRVIPTVQQIEKNYPNDVRLVFIHNPLPFHPNAEPAAEAAVAAGEQGKFWEMHDKLFANQNNLQRADFEKYAQEIGLDMNKFKAALDSHAGKKKVDGDLAVGKQVGVQGTPNFYIDGRNVQGAQPYEEFKKVIDDEIQRANKLIAQGTAPSMVYATFMKGAKASGGAAAGQAKGPGAGSDVYKIAVGDAPTRGAKQPKVTIIEYSDFQCPYCSRARETVDKLIKDYGSDVELAYKHNPLPFHQNAMPSALAAEAARDQGKFWEMHDILFSNQTHLERADLDKYAQQIGLNMGKFKESMDKEQGKDRIKRDMAEAEKFGARGTPNFFINGRNLRGAQPYESFKATVDEEIKKADAKIAAGTPRGQVYAALTEKGLEKAAPPPPPPARGGEPDANTRYRAEIKGSPMKGDKNAPVTIVQWSDYQCPFCGRVEPTVAKVMDEYKGKVRVVWRDLPLPFHPNAMPSAIAARAAGEQGKYWEMHDKLFADQQHQDRATFEKYAQELGLNMAKFKAALDAQKGKEAIEADAAAGGKIGAHGTPAFFVNGKFLSGAQPFEVFKAKIDEELKTADGLIAKGTPKAKVYDVLMKDAKAEVPAAPAQPQGQAEKTPEQDETVYKVAAGNAPAKGSKGAPLQVVIFSDFQCPFCKRVEPQLSQLEKEYGGKVHMAWKNYPLPFHNNAEPAAEAAMAANAQGKFWEMHDKLFANNTALDRASLEKYAQELGLDMAKFKADLDAQKYKAQIESDTKEGSAVGVNGTPAVFINGRKINGAYPWETFKKIADDELAKKQGKGGKKG
ncbi:MAG TPA: thioredoxin domain-containing protein [Polyangia bacterium]|nr:thioredoxin domain-containing protein [Polyangia bacterium]